MKILDLLNKVQEFNSNSNAINQQKQSLGEISEQIIQGENVLEIMRKNKSSIEKNISDLENEKSLIEPQVDILYDLVKLEYTEFSKFDEKDENYSQKINQEQEFVNKLNIVEKILGKELTQKPKRVIKVEFKNSENI